MPFLEFIGALALAYIGAVYTPFNHLEDINTVFAQRVDAMESCWYRIDGEPGSYGSPHNYSLDLLCRYRIVDGRVIRY
jgi:hypothetical protein